jgi:hypothetical protein
VLIEQGMEIEIGRKTLVAEGRRSAGLRAFLSRLLGWGRQQMGTVDQALRSLRLTATGRETLILSGEGDLVPIARAIHHRVKSPDQPFVVCDPKRVNSQGDVRSAKNCRFATDASASAHDGTLCMRGGRLPEDVRVLFEERVNPSRLQLIVCDPTPGIAGLRLAHIEIPPLRTREDEIDRIIDECAVEAFATLDILMAYLSKEDRDLVRIHWSSSIAEIDRAVRRLVALRASRHMSDAAARLGMAPVSLSRWFGRKLEPKSFKTSGTSSKSTTTSGHE